LVRIGQAPAVWRLAAALGHEDYQGIGLRTIRNDAWEIALLYLDDRARRLLSADYAERTLRRERKAGREPDERSWEAVRVARAYAREEAGDEELYAAWAAARDAWAAALDAGDDEDDEDSAWAWAAAWATTRVDARDAALAAAWSAAWGAALVALDDEDDEDDEDAAWGAECQWQRRRAADYVLERI